uniref:Peptidase A1 domain-containing protein n=1 Tax=Mycena chlorophos TaxID=658473 RepID=A0ABQ0LVK4_MYCCL|nr:predicted protein [Mycena chlorophos]
MDGVFGLGLGCDPSWEDACGAKPDLFVPHYCQGRRHEVRDHVISFKSYRLLSAPPMQTSTFTLALGLDHPVLDMKSWLIIGANNSSPTQDPKADLIPHLGWSQPMESRDPDGRFWVLELKAFGIGGKLKELKRPMGMIIDSGSSISSLPEEMCEALHVAMAAGVVDYGEGYVDLNHCTLDQQVTLYFNDDFTITAPSLKSFLDYRHTAGHMKTFSAFRSGLVGGTPFGLIGNALLRGLVIEFKYPNNPTLHKGSMRVAMRNPEGVVKFP